MSRDETRNSMLDLLATPAWVQEQLEAMLGPRRRDDGSLQLAAAMVGDMGRAYERARCLDEPAVVSVPVRAPLPDGGDVAQLTAGDLMDMLGQWLRKAPVDGRNRRTLAAATAGVRACLEELDMLAWRRTVGIRGHLPENAPGTAAAKPGDDGVVRLDEAFLSVTPLWVLEHVGNAVRMRRERMGVPGLPASQAAAFRQCLPSMRAVGEAARAFARHGRLERSTPARIGCDELPDDGSDPIRVTVDGLMGLLDPWTVQDGRPYDGLDEIRGAVGRLRGELRKAGLLGLRVTARVNGFRIWDAR